MRSRVGSVLVEVPAFVRMLGCWTVRVGETTGTVGCKVITPAGRHLCAIEGVIVTQNVVAHCRVHVGVNVRSSETTKVQFSIGSLPP
jgi:hypothetical protein